MNIRIIGLGQIGKSILYLLKNNQSLSIYVEDIDYSEFVRGSFDLNKADVVFVCVSSENLFNVLSSVRQSTYEFANVVILTKGISNDKNLTPAELGSRILGDDRIGILAGSMIAKEILDGKRSYATFASASHKITSQIFDLFNNTPLMVETSRDVYGVSCYSILKNIYTVGYGILSQLEMGKNTEGAYFAKSLNEMKYIADTIFYSQYDGYSYANTADFISTSMSEDSHNYNAGLELVRDGKISTLSEGVKSIAPMVSRLGDYSKNTPILLTIAEIIGGNRDMSSIYDSLL